MCMQFIQSCVSKQSESAPYYNCVASYSGKHVIANIVVFAMVIHTYCHTSLIILLIPCLYSFYIAIPYMDEVLPSLICSKFMSLLFSQ